jgi:hypothetical protein
MLIRAAASSIFMPVGRGVPEQGWNANQGFLKR